MSRAVGGTLIAALCVVGLAASSGGEISWAVAVLPSGAEFRLEIADDPVSRERGYMFRERVGPDEGMLFIFPRSRPQSFWMKNCRVALDMIFLDESFRVVEIAHEQQPCPEEGPCPSVSSLRYSRYVLEVAGGTARKHGLAPGDRITVLSEPSIR